ncbi:MAG: Wzz/FepE/Etk N-terminal domain-containing protein, partial [Salinibacter sp.]
MPSQKNEDHELRDYLFGLWAEKWLILAVFVGTVAVVAAVTLLLLPDRYESKASLLIMPPVANQLGADQRLEVDGSGTLRLREEGQLATLLNPRAYERLAQADDLIQTIIQDLELRQSPNNESPELMGVNALKRRVEVDAFPGGQAKSGDPRSVWLTIRVRGQDPAQVRSIVDAWAQRVIDRHREIADAAAQRAHDLIKRRLADVKETLKTKRRNKNDYLQDHSRSLLKAELDGLLNVYRSRWERSRSTDSDRQTNTGQDEVQTASQMRSLRQAIRKRDAEL